MGKQFLKKKSKRVTARKRYKIEKKVREHNRKLKRLDKAKKQTGKKGKKLIIVPGDCPFKEQILAEATALKENILKEKETRKEQAKADKKARKALFKETGVLPGGGVAPHNVAKKKDTSAAGQGGNTAGETKTKESFAELIKRAQDRGYHFEKIEEQKKKTSGGDVSLKAFYREFQQVVSESDVVIQVLDSRDPLGTRSSDAEEAVRSQADKKLLMVMNKCDLVPMENLQKWIAYLKQTTGCAVVPFKANTQKQKDRFGSIGVVNTDKGTIDTKKSVGVSDLLGILGNWARNSAGGITIGVIGMPNVGKSSLINSLKRSKACNVGAKPGITRTCQVISLDSKLKLIDSPGICFSKETGNESISLEKIIARVPKATLLAHYGISDFQDPEEFLCNISMKYGMLKKGGVPNTAASENKLVHDWHTGAIRFFTEPPELTSTESSATIVTSLSEPFSLDKFDANKESEMAVDDDDDDDDDDQEEDMSDDTVEPAPQPTGRLTRSAAKRVSFNVDSKATETVRNRRDAKRQRHPEETISPEGMRRLGLATTKKTLMKKIQKNRKKTAKKADALSAVVENLKF